MFGARQFLVLCYVAFCYGADKYVVSSPSVLPLPYHRANESVVHRWANDSFFASPSRDRISTIIDKPFIHGCQDPHKAAENQPRVNATFVMLARNSELEGVLHTIDSIERHFNQWFNYPYVFLNNDPFSDTFKELVTNATSSSVQFGIVDDTMFGFPIWVDESWAKEAIENQGDRGIMYGSLASYHHMCRFFSGYSSSLFANSGSFINMNW